MPLTPDGRRRMVTDFLSTYKFGPKSKPAAPDWLLKIETIVNTVQSHVKQICQAGGAAKPKDREALRETVFTMLLQHLDTLSKEELHFFSTTIIADRIMADVEASPWGGDKPDLLSGQ